ncbi:MAG TPA: alkaline phosphatase family protein, partial [Steroidobacteraceae bacterium]
MSYSDRARPGRLIAIACALLFALQAITAAAQPQGAISWPGPGERRPGRTIVLGFDGMDPVLARRWMDKGILPNFRRLAERGSFQPLPTTNPPQSPVAWASFATGTNPGAHGLFDFLKRNAESYAPEYAIAHTADDGRKLEFLGLSIPLSEPTVVNARVGKPFWSAAEEAGLRASVLRVPVTFPPDDITRMLSGMGVPDLLGTQGTFTFYSTRKVKGENTRAVKVTPQGGRVETVFEGPLNPLFQAPEPLGVPLVIESAGKGRVKIDLDGTAVTLTAGQWSGWIPLRFSIAWVIGVPAMVRLHLVKAFPDLELYVSPIQIDPRDPVQPITSPPEYAAALAESIGLYHTIGMPEETWSLN